MAQADATAKASAEVSRVFMLGLMQCMATRTTLGKHGMLGPPSICRNPCMLGYRLVERVAESKPEEKVEIVPADATALKRHALR